MRQVVEMSFAGEAARVVSFDSGEALLRHAQAEPPDVVIADARLAGMDGYSLAAGLKADERTSSVPVVLLTHALNPVDQPRFEELGIAGHIDKPFESRGLIEVVGQALQGASAASARTAAPRPVSSVTETEPPAPVKERPKDNEVAPANREPRAQGAPPPFPRDPPPLPDGLVGAVEMIASILPPGQAGALTEDLYARMGELGLSSEQLTAVVAVARDVVERVAWEVVPELAETIIREEIKRLTSE